MEAKEAMVKEERKIATMKEGRKEAMVKEERKVATMKEGRKEGKK